MKPETTSQTALGTAVGRALETARRNGDRLFEDQFAMGLLPRGHRGMVHLLRVPVLGAALLRLRERQVPGVMGNLLCRTRFIDDVLQGALEEGVEQVVILGAGLDSRAFRIPGIDRVRVFEVDHPATQDWKRSRVEDLFDAPPAHVEYAPVDFDRQALGEALDAAGFDASRTTLFIWEGVTQYITADAVDVTLRYVAQAVAPGSRIVFTYVHRGLIDGTTSFAGADRLLAEVERQGEPWRFGIDPGELPGYLASRGLRLVEDVGADDYRARYLEPIGREIDLFAGERIAVAEVVGGAEPTS